MTVENINDISADYRIVSQKIVSEMIGYSRNRIYELVKEGRFPKPLKLNDNGAIGWRLSKVMSWIDSREV